MIFHCYVRSPEGIHVLGTLHIGNPFRFKRVSKVSQVEKNTHCPGQVAGQPLWKDPSVPSPGTQVAGKFMEDFSDGKPDTKMFIMSGWDYYSQNMEK